MTPRLQTLFDLVDLFQAVRRSNMRKSNLICAWANRLYRRLDKSEREVFWSRMREVVIDI